MTAFADAMIFLIIIMMAISVTVHINHIDHDADIGPDDLLRDISSIELRLSDLTDIDDDSLVFLPDLMALSLKNETDVYGYLKCILDAAFGENRYCLFYQYGGLSKQIGTKYDFYASQDTRSIPVSIGGSIDVTLGIV